MNIKIRVGGDAILNPEDIRVCTIKHNVNQTAPTGILAFADRQDLVAQLKIMVGTRIQIFPLDSKAAAESDDWIAEMYVAEIQIKDASIHTFSGLVVCVLEHPLIFFQKVGDKAWEDSKTSNKIIKEVLDDNKTYTNLKIIKDKKLDDGEEIQHPIFQDGMLGIDFIEQRVIPFSTLQDMPPMFYIDYHHIVHFTQLRKLWTEKPQMTIGSMQAFEAQAKEKEGFRKSFKTDEKLILRKISFGMSPNRSLVNCFNVGFQALDNGTGATASGKTNMYIKVDDSGALPFDKTSAAEFDDGLTSQLQLKNKSFNDIVCEVLGTQRAVFNAIYCKASLLDFYPKLDLGQTVYLISDREGQEGDGSSDGGVEKPHWFDGQWYVYGLDMEVVAENSEGQGNLVSTAILARPCIPGDVLSNSTIKDNNYLQAQ